MVAEYVSQMLGQVVTWQVGLPLTGIVLTLVGLAVKVAMDYAKTAKAVEILSKDMDQILEEIKDIRHRVTEIETEIRHLGG